ncbi:hypothetical protein KIPB_005018 [Kipferlia bialata]|uniref:Uncharacterized protein n=1 Tax=Kipferlia bialata TaxID=797122 RepID=A0A9K3CUP9_9EUKA|nr:hypothetical protein KIPB_005018 [Kipferlia bialata]|eukprot:g5018.t1
MAKGKKKTSLMDILSAPTEQEEHEQAQRDMRGGRKGMGRERERPAPKKAEKPEDPGTVTAIEDPGTVTAIGQW